jgi:hypothetical protein
MNVKLLRAVKRMILEEPRRLNMAHFAAMFTKEDRPEQYVSRHESHQPTLEERPPCGAVMCVAGHTILADERERGIFRKRFTRTVVHRINNAAHGEAQRLLGLTETEAHRLFYFKGWDIFSPQVGWPDQFAEAYYRAKTPRQRAQATARRIEHFIRTKGKE